MRLLHPKATRCEPYSDGPWCFAYDPSHLPMLGQLKAYEVLLAVASGVDADRRLEQLTQDGLILACELDQDNVVVDILVGKRLTAAQRRKAKWMKPQGGYLSIPSGRLRVESLNCLSFGPDEPGDEGCELEVPPGEYDVVLHRVDWELMDVETVDERPELPVILLELMPAGKKGPQAREALLRLGDALGEDRAWITEGKVKDAVFHGTVRRHEARQSVWVNLRGALAEELGLRFGQTLELTSGAIKVRAPYTGYLSRRGLEGYFGRQWYEKCMSQAAIICGMSPYKGGTPWLLDVEGSVLPVDASVKARVLEPWCEIPVGYRGECEIQQGSITGRVAFASSDRLILNFGAQQLREAKLPFHETLELVVGGRARTLYMDAAPREVLENAREAFLEEGAPERTRLKQAHAAALKVCWKAEAEVAEAEYEGRDGSAAKAAKERAWEECRRLKAELDATMPPPEHFPSVPLILAGMTYWDDPEVIYSWIRPLAGDRHELEATPGGEAVVRR